MNNSCIKHKKHCPHDLTCIPGIGPSIQKDLYSLGINTISDLENKCPEAMYEQLCRQQGMHIDRCVLYVFRCAVCILLRQKSLRTRSLRGGGGRISRKEPAKH